MDDGTFTPYAPPGGHQPTSTVPLQPMATLTQWTFALTIAVLVAQAVSAALGTQMYSFQFQGGPGGFAELGRMMALTMLLSVIGIAQIIVGVLWFYRARDNVERSGMRGGTWVAGWAVGAWFIPIARMVLPLFVIREIHQGSHPEATPQTWKQMPVPGWIYVWWVFWVIPIAMSGLVGFIFAFASFRTAMAGGDPTGFLEGMRIYSWISAACYIVAGVFFLRWMKDIESWQRARGA